MAITGAQLDRAWVDEWAREFGEPGLARWLREADQRRACLPGRREIFGIDIARPGGDESVVATLHPNPDGTVTVARIERVTAGPPELRVTAAIRRAGRAFRGFAHDVVRVDRPRGPAKPWRPEPLAPRPAIFEGKPPG